MFYVCLEPEWISYLSHWQLEDLYILHLQCKWWENKSIFLPLYKNVFKSLLEVNKKLQPNKDSSLYLQSFKCQMPSFPKIKQIFSLKRLTMKYTTFIWQAQTAETYFCWIKWSIWAGGMIAAAYSVFISASDCYCELIC